MKARIRYVDIAKGIGILLVVLCHIMSNSSIYNIIYMFHMPLFFFLSGITFNNTEKFTKFIEKKFRGICIPYFLFSIVSFIYWILIERKIRNQLDISAFKNFVNILLCQVENNLYIANVVLWFLPCLFISSIIAYNILKKKKGVIYSLLLLIIGYILCTKQITLPFTLETSFIAQFFIICGFYFNKAKKFNNNLLYLLISILLFIFSAVFNTEVNMLSHSYGNLLLFVMGSISGIYIMIFVCRLIKKSLVLEKIGKMSLLIMCCHEPLKRIVLQILSLLLNESTDIIRTNYIVSIVALVIIIIIIFPFNYLINKYVPFILGKRKSYINS